MQVQFWPSSKVNGILTRDRSCHIKISNLPILDELHKIEKVLSFHRSCSIVKPFRDIPNAYMPLEKICHETKI